MQLMLIIWATSYTSKSAIMKL